MPARRELITHLREENRRVSTYSSKLDIDGVNTVELEKRFQELSGVLRKARESFSCRLEEEQANPLKELCTRLFRAKERFHSRLANSSRFPDHGGFYPVEPENPFQELRSVLRSARINFVPLLDQYILENTSSSNTTWNSSSDSFDLSPEPASNIRIQSTTATRLFQARDRETTRSSNKNTATKKDIGDECPSSLHPILEEGTRYRSRNRTSDSPTAGFKSSNPSVPATPQKLESPHECADGVNQNLGEEIRYRSRIRNWGAPTAEFKTSTPSVPATPQSLECSEGLHQIPEAETPFRSRNRSCDSGAQTAGFKSSTPKFQATPPRLESLECASLLEVPEGATRYCSRNRNSNPVEGRRSLNSNVPVTAPEIEPQLQEGRKKIPPSLALAISSVQRLNVLISEELDRTRASGRIFRSVL